MKLQQDNIKCLLELIQANPDIRILPIVDTECVPSDDFNSWVGSWGNARIEEVWDNIDKERVYIKSYDYDDLVDEVWEEADPEISEEEAKQIVDSCGWEKVIIVGICAP